MKYINFLKICCISATVLLTYSCSIWNKDQKSEEKKDEITNITKKRFEPNVLKRSDDNVSSGTTIFGKSKDSKPTDNIIWRASLEVLNKFPLMQADYQSGIIITDWYTVKNSDESVKLTIKIFDTKIQASSFTVESFKRICPRNKQCYASETNMDFNAKIKSLIVDKIKELNIAKN